MPEMLDSIHYIFGNFLSIIDVKWEYLTRKYIVSLYKDNELDARIIFGDLDSAKNVALDHLANCEL